MFTDSFLEFLRRLLGHEPAVLFERQHEAAPERVEDEPVGHCVDESARDRAFLRDAALSNMVPSIAANVSGFFAYRYGHMVFEYIEEAVEDAAGRFLEDDYRAECIAEYARRELDCSIPAERLRSKDQFT